MGQGNDGIKMTIDEYGKFTEEIWFSKHQIDCEIFNDIYEPRRLPCTCDQDAERSLTIMSLGLAGETGEVMEILKKRIRDGEFEKDKFVKEMGDVAYYWARLCMAFGVQPSEVLEVNKSKLLDRKARGAMRGNGSDR